MARAHSPFSPFTVLALVLAGGGMLLAMLWMVGSGLVLGEINNGGGHAGGRGLNGYAGLYRLYEAAGYDVSLARDPDALTKPGLLILTPPADAKGEEIAKIVAAHRQSGPVLVISPKWQAMPATTEQPGVEKGWVRLGDTQPPEWKGFLDDVTVRVDKAAEAGDDSGRDDSGRDDSGHVVRLPRPDAVMSGQGARLFDWVRDDHGRILAARYDDTDDKNAPEAMLALVFEPDLANNAGLAHKESAEIMLAMVEELVPTGDRHIVFDVTLNGFGRSPNLLSLAFTPPYLAATLCLILAAIAAGWRAFHRFGPALAEGREIAFGKRALAENAAGLIRRSGRLRLLPAPYADAARGRIIVALGLPAHGEGAANDAAIDRALDARAPAHEPFTAALSRLRAAHSPAEILRAAQSLHAIERMLTR